MTNLRERYTQAYRLARATIQEARANHGQVCAQICDLTVVADYNDGLPEVAVSGALAPAIAQVIRGRHPRLDPLTDPLWARADQRRLGLRPPIR